MTTINYFKDKLFHTVVPSDDPGGDMELSFYCSQFDIELYFAQWNIHDIVDFYEFSLAFFDLNQYKLSTTPSKRNRLRYLLNEFI